MYFIGIDLGTSAVKLLLMKSGGEIIRTVSESYPASTAMKLQVSASAARCTDLLFLTARVR